jgi:4-amino-4-deoxy-L-arabinose transferase
MRSCADPARAPGAVARPASRGTLWTALLLLVLAFAFQGSRGLYELDESRYAGIALQMLDSGQWWVPEYNAGEPHVAKPPLTYWSIAASMGVLGRNAWAARLPSALAFVFTGLLVIGLAQALGSMQPWRAGVLWAGMLAPFVGSNIVLPDPLLALFETLAVLGFVRSGLLSSAVSSRKALQLMWLGLGLAFLAKGTPALLPLLAAATWLGWQRRWRALAALFIPEGLLAFVVLGLGWYLSIVAVHSDWLPYFLGHEVVDRMFSGAHHRNNDWVDIFRVYGPTLLLGALPWLPLLLVRRKPAGGGAAGSDRLQGSWLVWWFTVPLIVFALSQSRLPHYLLPLFVPLALLLERRCRWLTPRTQWQLLWFAGVWLLGLIALKGGAARFEPDADVRRLSREIAPAAARLSHPLADIAFVDHRTVHGLRLYTGKPVREAMLPGIDPRPDRLYTPLLVCAPGNAPAGRLWLVPERLAGRFVQVTAGCGLAARALGPPLREWLPYEVLPGA